MADPITYHFGRRLAAARVASGLGVNEFALACGVTRNAIHRWENDEFAPRSVRWIDARERIAAGWLASPYRELLLEVSRRTAEHSLA